MTFPVLVGLTIEHPNSSLLKKLYAARNYDRDRICALLDQMDVRTRLMHLALDHRDQALKVLGDNQGRTILKLWLDWLLRDGARLLEQ
jgi:hypothetical protein